MPVDALLFDKDGTLFEFAATWEAFARSFLLRISGGDGERAKEIGQAIGFDMVTNTYAPDSIVIAGTPGEVAEAIQVFFPDTSHVDLVDMINEEAAQAPQAEAVPLAAFLDQMRSKGLKLGVATNDAESPARAHLSAAGVQDKFDFIAGFDSGHGAKPAPGQLLAFASHVGVEPARVAMVGDSTHDLMAGRAAGMTTIGVLTGMASENDLMPHADVVLPNIGYIAEWLTR